MWKIKPAKILGKNKSESESRSLVSDSLWPYGLHRPWNSPGQNTGVGSLSLLQGIFPTQINPGLPHSKRILYYQEAEVPLLWLPDMKSQLNGKNPDAGKDWRQEENGKTEDEMVGCHHWLNGHEFEQALGDGGGQGSLVCYIVCGVSKSQIQQQSRNERKHKKLNIRNKKKVIYYSSCRFSIL